MSKKNSLVAALIFAGIALSANVSAQTYVGGALSQARWDFDCTGASSCDRSDTGYKFFIGYDFTQIWGMEASYFTNGTATASAPGLKTAFTAKGLEFSGLVKTPRLKGFAGFAKLGLTYVRAESGVTIDNLSGTLSKSSAQPVFGLGVTYLIGDNTSVRAEYERRRAKFTNVSGTTADINVFSVGLQASY